MTEKTGEMGVVIVDGRAVRCEAARRFGAGALRARGRR